MAGDNVYIYMCVTGLPVACWLIACNKGCCGVKYEAFGYWC